MRMIQLPASVSGKTLTEIVGLLAGKDREDAAL